MKRESVELIHKRKQATIDHWTRFFPIAIFSPDGTAEHVNGFFLWLFGIEEASLFVGKYNLLNDKAYRGKKSIYEKIQRAFNGEMVTLCNFKAPTKTLVDMGIIKGKPPELPPMDVDLMPTYENKKFDSVHFIFYYGRKRSKEQIARSREQRKARDKG